MNKWQQFNSEVVSFRFCVCVVSFSVLRGDDVRVCGSVGVRRRRLRGRTAPVPRGLPTAWRSAEDRQTHGEVRLQILRKQPQASERHAPSHTSRKFIGNVHCVSAAVLAELHLQGSHGPERGWVTPFPTRGNREHPLYKFQASRVDP